MPDPAGQRFPDDRSWVVSIHGSADLTARPIGTGVVIDGHRILTCAHVVDAVGGGDLHVTFPMSAVAQFEAAMPVAEVRRAAHPRADVAVLIVPGTPEDVLPPSLGRTSDEILPGQPWWAFGFTDHLGNEADGTIGAALGFGWIRIDSESRYHVEGGFSGGGLWSPAYRTVVGLVGQAKNGDGRAITMPAIIKALPDEKLDLLVGAQPVKDAGSDAAHVWGWALAKDAEGIRHWRPRARGVSGDSERGYRFSGRTTALTQIREWLQRDQTDHQVLVVTGSPGVGKSTVLARIVTTADAGIAAQLPDDDTAIRAPIGSVACAVHAKGKTALEVATEIARAAGARLPERIEDTLPALREALASNQSRRFTVVVDALDEAATSGDARAIIRDLLVPLVETCADLGAQVLAGTRRHDPGGELIATFGAALTVIDLDTDTYFEIDDLITYAQATLQLRGAERPGNPYQADNIALPIATRIAEVADRNFLVAGLKARTHGLHDTTPTDPATIHAVDHGHDPVAVRLREYLTKTPGPAADVSAADALTALAFAETPGFDITLWQIAIHALTGHLVPHWQLTAFAAGPAANFLIETSAQASSHRLFHQALNDTLLDDRRRIHTETADQAVLTAAFLAHGQDVGWSDAPPYLYRSLPHHAAAARAIDDVLADPIYLLYADLLRLLPVADSARTSLGQERYRLLRRTPAAVHASPVQRLSLLSTVEVLRGFSATFTTLDTPAPYRGRWANALPESTLATLDGHTSYVTAVCQIQVGNQTVVASASGDQTIRLWDPATGTHIATFNGHSGSVTGICQIQAGNQILLASASRDRTIRLWNPATSTELTRLKGHNSYVNAVCQIQTGNQILLASASSDQTIRLWDPATGTHIATFDGHSDSVMGICQIQTGNQILLASASSDQTIRLWDPATGTHAATLRGHSGPVIAVCQIQTRNQALLASAGDDGKVWLWDPATGAHIATLDGHTSGGTGVCQIQAGNHTLLASASNDQTVRLWEPVAGTLKGTLDGHTGRVSGVCQIQAGNHILLASASDDQTVRLWDYATGTHIATLAGHTRTVYGICQIQAGNHTLLASASDDQTVRLWDPVTGNQVITLEGPAHVVTGVCQIQAGDQTRLACASSDSMVRLWDPATGTQVTTLRGHTGWVSGVCQIQAGNLTLLASASRDQTVRLWDPTTGSQVTTLKGHSGVVNAVCQIQAGNRTLLASASRDQTVRLWDPATGTPVTTLEGHAGSVNAVCQIQAGNQTLLASASNDQTVRLWNPATLKLLSAIRVPGYAFDVAQLGETGLAIALEIGVLVVDLDPVWLASA